uniref:Cytochrome b561 bacterial/Ni-hydrogenase domain-containing protein n=1 Tax=Serratia marcescens TaxID=615 RepID=A0A1C3HM97_SERMA|nr:Uncharacterised protein [Serratia marcescens]
MKKNVRIRGNGRSWTDTPGYYGSVSRVLHWGMAYLMVWQFMMVLGWRAFGPSENLILVSRFGPDHGTVGLLTIVLIVLRAAWAFANRRHRPPHFPGSAGRISFAAHVILYLLMFVIPAFALLRVYGSGKGWSPWGVAFIPETGTEVSWMVTPADMTHDLMAWLLCCLIVGHILAALFHRFVLRDHILARMAGTRTPQN